MPISFFRGEIRKNIGRYAIAAAGVLLLAYIAFLLAINYSVQQKLRKVGVEQLRRDLERRAAAVEYFLEERKSEVASMAQGTEIYTYFNKSAWGGYTGYDPKTDLLPISRQFGRLMMQGKWMEEKPVYTMIVLSDTSGNILVERSPTISPEDHHPEMSPYLTPHQNKPSIITRANGSKSYLSATVPYFFNGVYMAQIVAWLDPEVIVHLAQKASNFPYHAVGMVYGGQFFPAIQDMAALSGYKNIPNPAMLYKNTCIQFMAQKNDGTRVSTLALRVPVPQTGLSVVGYIPESEVYGPGQPWHLPAAMGVLALFLAGSLAAGFRMHANNLMLLARLDEFAKKEREIASRKRELEKEVSERKRAQSLLLAARDELEERVRQRTLELAQANEGLKTEIEEKKRTAEAMAKMEKQLQQAQKMEAIGKLAGGIAHDFNNILAAIIGFSELAREAMKEGSLERSNLDEVIAAGSRAKELVGQILMFSRKADQKKKPVRMGQVVGEALRLIRSSLPSTIEIRHNIASNAVVMADPSQIHQIVMNLCTNAYQAMRGMQGVLEVTLDDVEGMGEIKDTGVAWKPYVRLTVSDNGQGMDEAVRERIFEPYFTTKEMGEGTGLGLAVVHGIVEAHGGIIQVESAVGKGSRFMVYLPREKSCPASMLQDKESPVPCGKEHILILDDEPGIINMLRQVLETSGYRVTSACGSLQGLDIFKRNARGFDMVITDMTMPSMTGADLAKEMLHIRPSIPIILCTGFHERMTGMQAREMGLSALVMKPYGKKEITRLIREILDGHVVPEA